jgi:hypothetical protein
MPHFLDDIINLLVRSIESFHLNNFWTLITSLLWLYLLVAVFCILVLIAITLLQRTPVYLLRLAGRIQNKDSVPPDTLLELAFPFDISKSAYATEQLHIPFNIVNNVIKAPLIYKITLLDYRY